MGAGGGGGGGLGIFNGGSVGGVLNPALGQPQSPPLNPMQLPAGSAGPMGGMNAPTPAQPASTPSAVDKLRGGIQTAANISQAWQDAGKNLQGGPFGQQQQGGGRPVNFNVSPQAYIPPPQNNPYMMSNAFYGQ